MMRKEVVVAVIMVLVVAGLSIGYLSGGSVRGTATITSTSTLTSQRTVTSTTTSTSTVKAIVVPGAADTALGSNGSTGVDLVLAINATTLKMGQRLNVVVALFNALPSANTLLVSGDWPWGRPGQVNFSGIPVIFGGPCDGYPFVRAAVLMGNYTRPELPSAVDSSLEWQCAEGGVMDNMTFAPYSSIARVTVNEGPSGANVVLAPRSMSISFVTDGYWNLQAFSSPYPNTPLVCLYSCANSPVATPFVPGVYTLAVSDEWGNEAILHFAVNG